MSALEIGVKGRATGVVTRENTAAMIKSGGAFVLATPAMVALMEQAAYESVERLLPEGMTTVGTRIDVRHTAATPKGKAVYAQSELVGIEGRMLKFVVRAFDEAGQIGEAEHERATVDRAKFVDRASKRSGA